MLHLRRAPTVEAPEPDERGAIAGIIAGMSTQVEDREGRASRARSTARAVGTLTVAAHLAPELAQEAFAEARTFDVAVRVAQGPGETLGGRASTRRDLAIKGFGAPGEPIPESDGRAQDVVLATGPTFASGTARGFLRDGAAIPGSAALPEWVGSAVSPLARNFNRALRPLGAGSARAGFLGHPFSRPFADSYFSQAPCAGGTSWPRSAPAPPTASLPTGPLAPSCGRVSRPAARSRRSAAAKPASPRRVRRAWGRSRPEDGARGL